LKNKILVVGDAIVNDKTFEIIERHLHVVKIEPIRLKSILSNETDFKAIWIHLDTFIDESLLARNSLSYFDDYWPYAYM